MRDPVVFLENELLYGQHLREFRGSTITSLPIGKARIVPRAART